MLKIYGSQLCPDCVKCKEDLDAAGVPYLYLNISENLLYLKKFLKLRDENEGFDLFRSRAFTKREYCGNTLRR